MKAFTNFKTNIYSFLYFLCLFLVSVTSLSSQNWLEDGQQWRYDVIGGWNPAFYGIYTLNVVGDTIIAETECKILSLEFPEGSYEDPIEHFAYAYRDAVYSYYNSEVGFVKMYDFLMESGDTLMFPNEEKYRVDSIGIMHIGGNEIRFQHISFFNSASWDYGWHGTYLILEGIGFIGKINSQYAMYSCSFFNVYNIPCSAASDGQEYRFQCFNGDNFIYDPYDLCLATSTDEVNRPVFKIYPNPTSGFLKIESSSGIKAEQVVLYDLLGRMVYSSEIKDSKVSIAHLPAQTYFLKIRDSNGVEYSFMIMVN